MPKKFIIFVPIVLLVLLLIGGVIFIKVNTPLAAEITDKYLRPVLGDSVVIFVERIFYNASDKFTQLTYTNGHGVDFLNTGDTSNVSGGNLDLGNITDSFQSPLPGEGVWKNYRLRIFPNDEVMAYTFIRPDTSRPYAYVSLVQLDMSKLKLGAVAGIKEPASEVGKSGPGKIPLEIIKSNALVAAFNGGFQYRDGAYGMIVRDVTYLPLKNDLATLFGFSNGKLELIKYEGQRPSGQIDFIRQNCPILVENGQVATYSDANRILWGRTPTTSIYTWRSGIGITKNGNLIYAVGNNLVPDTLAMALKMAGAVNAMQLDINPYWVRFNIFDSNGDGTYKASILSKGLYDGSNQYLNGYQKDFFYVYKK